MKDNVFSRDSDPLGTLFKEVSGLIKENGRLRLEINEEKLHHNTEIKKILSDIIIIGDSICDILDGGGKTGSGKRRAVNRKSVELLYNMVIRTLENFGVTLFEKSEYQKVDPEKHHVVETDGKFNAEDENITKVLKKGFRWKGEVIRPAEVKVAIK